jgi:recombination protein RecA
LKCRCLDRRQVSRSYLTCLASGLPLDCLGGVSYSARGKGENKAKIIMPSLARADLEWLLRERKLDRTLTSALPVGACGDELVVAPTELAPLDAQLGGGFPRGQLSEIVGLRSSGRTSVLLQMLAAATARGELVALVDALDMFDADSASAAGIDFDRLLWIRGHVVTNPGMCRDLNQRAVDQAIKALTLVLQAGNFGIVALDMAEAPSDALRRLPFTTWLRLQRIIEGSQTACVLIGLQPMARSSSGLTVRLSRAGGAGRAGRAGKPGKPSREEVFTHPPYLPDVGSCRFRGRLFDGLDVVSSVIRARSRAHEEATAMFATVASHCD